MTSRRILEFWESNHSVEFRQRLLTDQPPSASSPLLIIRVTEAGDYTLDGHDVEELHQWTFEILAGRKTDPRLDVVDAQIMCGAKANSPSDGPLECVLLDGHRQIAGGPWQHITAEGVLFDTPGF
jgi:hypothetical protein